MVNSKKIMVVEDSELLHRMYDLIFMSFKSKGGQVIHANNGKEAFEKLKLYPDTSLIILDINMPVMSGLEFLMQRNKMKVYQDIPVVIVSTEGSEEDTIRGLEAGAKAYIKKPFQPSSLLKIVEKLLNEKM
jgi:two-component system chemotaxis response regulator CheY